MKPFNAEAAVNSASLFIQRTFKNAGFSRVVIGVSGGVDSAVSTLLAIKALGKDSVYPVLMPYGPLSTQATLDAMTFLSGAGIPVNQITRIDIKSAVDEIARQSGATDNLRRGNLMARVRMACLFDQAKKRNALVLGTENRTEHELGYFTRCGDEASDLEPLRNYWKSEVYELAKKLGVPENIINKPPSANLWFEQTDEKEFGFTYQIADQVLCLYLDEHKSIDEIAAPGLDRLIVEKIIGHHKRNYFKRLTPYIPEQI